MVIYISMEISEEESINKHCSLEVVNLVLKDPAVESCLLSGVAESLSVLIGDLDPVWSGHGSLHTSH